MGTININGAGVDTVSLINQLHVQGFDATITRRVGLKSVGKRFGARGACQLCVSASANTDTVRMTLGDCDVRHDSDYAIVNKDRLSGIIAELQKIRREMAWT